MPDIVSQQRRTCHLNKTSPVCTNFSVEGGIHDLIEPSFIVEHIILGDCFNSTSGRTMAAYAHLTVADSSSISPLSFYTPSSGGGAFQDAKNGPFLMDDDDDVSPLIDCHGDAAAGSDSAETSSNQQESGMGYRWIQGLTIARPSNPSLPSSSSSQRRERESATSDLSPLELIQQSKTYRHRPPHNIYVRHCRGLPLYDSTHVGQEKNQQQQELLVLINHHRIIQTSLATIDEEATTQKMDLLRTLASASGDAKDATFVAIVVRLGELREERRRLVTRIRNIESILQRWMGNTSDCSPSIVNEKYIANEKLEGQWFTLTKPTYQDCLGFNDDGDPLYTLGRMSFEMFFPGDLVCAIQAVFNPIMKVVPPSSKDPSSFSVPKTLQKEVKLALANDSGAVLKTYQ